jgi:hypothetical protein
MIKPVSLSALALLLACGLPVAPAQAQLSRTFVSAATGNDANNCDRPTPCRTFQGAHDKTNSDGEVIVLDPGGYGSLTITKSISIVNDGVGEAGMLVSGGTNGINVNAPAAGYVNLRGLTVQGIGFGGGNGLVFSSGFALTITNCVFRNHSGAAGGAIGNGIMVAPNVGGTHNVAILDTVVSDNSGQAVQVTPTAGAQALRVALDRVQIVNNGQDGFAAGGFGASGTIDATVTNTVSANNGRFGFNSASVDIATSVTVVRSVAANNSTGLAAGGTAKMRVGQSTITGNTLHTWFTSGGTLQSFGDNYIAGNADGDPALPGLIARK